MRKNRKKIFVPIIPIILLVIVIVVIVIFVINRKNDDNMLMNLYNDLNASQTYMFTEEKNDKNKTFRANLSNNSTI